MGPSFSPMRGTFPISLRPLGAYRGEKREKRREKGTRNTVWGLVTYRRWETKAECGVTCILIGGQLRFNETHHEEMIMFPTYAAILRAGQLEWENGAPPDDPVRVHVTVIAPLVASPVSGPSMASALEAIAAAGGPSGFDDPAEWQTQSRADRPLPGRTE